jgi:hypothetical protein
VAGMHKWLHKNGFSYKKPKGVPHKFDAAKQQCFVEQYKELKAQGKIANVFCTKNNNLT